MLLNVDPFIGSSACITLRKFEGWSGVGIGPAHRSLGEIDGLLVPPGKASKLMTDNLITGYPLKSEPAQENGLVFAPIHISGIGLLGWLYL